MELENLERTPWFNSIYFHPIRDGVYEIEIYGSLRYAKCQNCIWYAYCGTIRDADNETDRSTCIIEEHAKWRGLITNWEE